MEILKVEFKDSCSEAIFCDVTYIYEKKSKKSFFRGTSFESETVQITRTAYLNFFCNGKAYAPTAYFCDNGGRFDELYLSQSMRNQMVLAYENSLNK